MRRAVIATASRMERWTCVLDCPVSGLLRYEATSALFGFTDDIELRVSEKSAQESTVHARSASRIGAEDLGANRRRLARFFERLDEEVGH